MTARYPILTAAAAEERAAEERHKAAAEARRKATFSIHRNCRPVATITPYGIEIHCLLTRDQFADLVRSLVADGVLSLAELVP